MKTIVYILWLVLCLIAGAQFGEWTASKPVPMSSPTPNPAPPDLEVAAEALNDLSFEGAHHDAFELSIAGWSDIDPASDIAIAYVRPEQGLNTPLDFQLECQHDGKTYRTEWREVKP